MKGIKGLLSLMLALLIVICAFESYAEKTSYIVEFLKIVNERSHRPENNYEYLLNSISYPNKSVRHGPVEITISEICADTESLLSAVSFKLLKESQDDESLLGPMGPWFEEQSCAENQTVWLFNYYITTSGLFDDNACDWIQTDDCQWVRIDDCGRHYPIEESPVYDNQWIDITYNIMLQKIDGNQIETYQLDIQFPYQILPKLDQCEFHGEAFFEKANYKLTSLSLLVTPIRVYLEHESKEIDQNKDSPPLYYDCFDADGWYYSTGEYIERLPDTLYFQYMFVNKDKREESIVFSFSRIGNTYVYQEAE